MIVSIGRQVRLLRGTAVALVLAAAGTAQAQSSYQPQSAPEPTGQPALKNTAESGVSQDIVVTARKRSERAIDVPASLNVFSGDSLEAAGVVSLTDLQYQTPGLKIAVGGGGTRLSLRGVGTNISSGGPSVAVHLDGIYVPNGRFALGELFDAGRVEVLKGPEGTLYGRNATGGAINIISQAPGKEFAADGFVGFVGYGSYNLVQVQGGVTLPIGEQGGIRVSGIYANDDGYTKNINASGGEIDNRDIAAVRVRGRYALTEALTADITVQYSRDKGTVGYGGSNNPASPVFASDPPQRRDVRHINVDTPPRSDQEGLLLSGTLSLDLGGVTLKSLTGYIDFRAQSLVDVDGSGGLIAFTDQPDKSLFFSQEFQLSGGRAEGLNWTTGLYYSKERASSRSTETDADFPDTTPYEFSDVIQSRRNRSYAAFGEVTVPLAPGLSVVGGARYTSERQSGNGSLAFFGGTPTTNANATENDAFTPKLLVQYKPNDTSRFYASVTRGFKSGGVNLAQTATTYRPEKIWAYEAGTKNSFGGGKAELGLAAFYYDYTDLQLRSVTFSSAGFTTSINNASKAEIYGVEATGLARLAPGLSIDGNVSYLHSRLKNFILPGTTTPLLNQALPLTPKWSFTAGVQYSHDIGTGSLTARGELNYQSTVFFPNFGDLARERQNGYALVNGNIRYDFADKKVYVARIGRNLTNKTYLTQRFFFNGFSDTEFYGAPRTIEGRIGFNF